MSEVIYAFLETRNYPYLQYGIVSDIDGRSALVTITNTWGSNTVWVRPEFTLKGEEGKTLSEQLDKLAKEYTESLQKFNCKFDRKRVKLYGKYL